MWPRVRSIFLAMHLLVEERCRLEGETGLDGITPGTCCWTWAWNWSCCSQCRPTSYYRAIGSFWPLAAPFRWPWWCWILDSCCADQRRLSCHPGTIWPWNVASGLACPTLSIFEARSTSGCLAWYSDRCLQSACSFAFFDHRQHKLRHKSWWQNWSECSSSCFCWNS